MAYPRREHPTGREKAKSAKLDKLFCFFQVTLNVRTLIASEAEEEAVIVIQRITSACDATMP